MAYQGRTSDTLGDNTHRVTYEGPRDAWGAVTKTLYIRVSAYDAKHLGASAPTILAGVCIRNIEHGHTAESAYYAIITIEEITS